MFCYGDYVKVIIEYYYWSLDIVTSYDKEKYRDLLLDAAETVLGYFGFDGSVYRRSENRGIRSSKQKKWWNELREERIKDVEIERDN
jgi:hypothetical protein